MSLNNDGRGKRLGSLAALVLGACALTACSGNNAPAATADTNTTAPKDGGNAYELVMQQRTDPVHGERVAMRIAYDICVEGAKALNQPAKPFPADPADPAVERNTVITDGRSYVRKTEQLSDANTEKMQPDQGCEFSIWPVTTETLITHQGKATRVKRDYDGKITTETDDDVLSQVAKSPQDNSHFSERRTVNGVNLRCMPKDDPTLAALLKATGTQDLCIYEKDGQLLNADGTDMVLYSRVTQPVQIGGTSHDTIVEPVSLKRLDHVDPATFDPATYSR
ncbi:hypothetical protein EC912_10778 [Luteibacter rhizovicinus]|uniref:Lipoprotein n=1 Tax=Luteibacter rhizovicinus TaxID=242606 RepID=A0A4R3YJN3_9GAMM|nr:hypothetical protein [Luteibacter rhizovicinus]TCV92371.1 hypothetical protein EC912_10778 [Luteibacter rhizovicinus]